MRPTVRDPGSPAPGCSIGPTKDAHRCRKSRPSRREPRRHPPRDRPNRIRPDFQRLAESGQYGCCRHVHRFDLQTKSGITGLALAASPQCGLPGFQATIDCTSGHKVIGRLASTPAGPGSLRADAVPHLAGEKSRSRQHPPVKCESAALLAHMLGTDVKVPKELNRNPKPAIPPVLWNCTMPRLPAVKAI